MLKIHECTCLRCGWKWTPRIPDPRICPNPKCHSLRWDTLPADKDGGLGTVPKGE